MSLFSFMGALEMGFIFALVALGVLLSFRILDFPDLTADGSFKKEIHIDLFHRFDIGALLFCGQNRKLPL